ncbi:anticodon binding domain protein [Ostertagia ostertagi]
MFAACGAGADQFKTVCSSVDKLDKQPWVEVEEELIKEKGLTKENTEKLGQFVRLREFNPSMGNVELLDKLMEFEELAKNARFKKGIEELKVLVNYCSLFGVNSVRFDPSLARGLDYYTGAIYEAVVPKALEGINLETNGEEQKGLPVGVGSVAAGGRSLRLEDVGPLKPNLIRSGAQEFFTNERMSFVELAYKANPKLLTQLQYCEDRLIPLVLIVGERELQEGVVKLRNVKTRAEQSTDYDGDDDDDIPGSHVRRYFSIFFTESCLRTRWNFFDKSLYHFVFQMVYPASVFITGANRGIGLGFVREFLKIQSVKFVIAGARNPDNAEVNFL